MKKTKKYSSRVLKRKSKEKKKVEKFRAKRVNE